MANNTINFTINLDGNAYTGIAQIDKALGNVLVSAKNTKSFFERIKTSAFDFNTITDAIGKVTQAFQTMVGTSLNFEQQQANLKTLLFYSPNFFTPSLPKALASPTNWTSNGNTCAVGNNPTSNNTTGFNAVPSGGNFGSCSGFGINTFFWITTQSNSNNAYYHSLYYDTPYGFIPPIFLRHHYKLGGIKLVEAGCKDTLLKNITLTVGKFNVMKLPRSTTAAHRGRENGAKNKIPQGITFLSV